jgi:hypothetical protein
MVNDIISTAWSIPRIAMAIRLRRLRKRCA